MRHALLMRSTSLGARQTVWTTGDEYRITSGRTAAIHGVRRRLARLVLCYMSAYQGEGEADSADEACRLPRCEQGSRQRSPVDGRRAGYGEGERPDWGECSCDGEEKEEVHSDREARHDGRWRSRSQRGQRGLATVAVRGAAWVEGCAYAVLARGRATGGGEVTRGYWGV